MKEEWDMLSVTDMVYNHTANDSPWLQDHPDSSYNLTNSPHLKPAYLLDRVIHYTSQQIAVNKLVGQNLPAELSSGGNSQAVCMQNQAVSKSTKKIKDFSTLLQQ